MATIRKYKELLLGIAMILIAVVYITATADVQIRIQTTFNSRFVPYILGAMTLALGVLQCVHAMKGIRHAKASDKAGEGEPSDPLAVVLTFALIVLYVATLRTVGFLVNTIWMMFFMMLLMAPREKWRPLLFAVVSVATSAIIYYTFREGLQLMLPGGIMG